MNKERFAHYRTGIAIIDEEHYSLIEKMNVISMLCRSDPSDMGEITLLLNELEDELLKHLAHEEEMMFAASYKYAAPHKEEHNRLRERMKALLHSIPSQSPRMLNYVVTELEHIVVTHIDHFDMQIKL